MVRAQVPPKPKVWGFTTPIEQGGLASLSPAQRKACCGDQRLVYSDQELRALGEQAQSIVDALNLADRGASLPDWLMLGAWTSDTFFRRVHVNVVPASAS